MRAEELSPELRLHLVEALDLLSGVLEEETEMVSHADTKGLDLYLATKRRLFERLGILLREAHRPAPPPALIAAPAGEMADDAAAESEPVEDPAPPVRVREASDRLRGAIAANLRALTAAQDAVTAVTRHLARIAAREQADGVYGRRGGAPQRAIPGYGCVEHQL